MNESQLSKYDNKSYFELIYQDNFLSNLNT